MTVQNKQIAINMSFTCNSEVHLKGSFKSRRQMDQTWKHSFCGSTKGGGNPPNISKFMDLNEFIVAHNEWTSWKHYQRRGETSTSIGSLQHQRRKETSTSIESPQHQRRKETLTSVGSPQHQRREKTSTSIGSLQHQRRGKISTSTR